MSPLQKQGAGVTGGISGSVIPLSAMKDLLLCLSRAVQKSFIAVFFTGVLYQYNTSPTTDGQFKAQMELYLGDITWSFSTPSTKKH